MSAPHASHFLTGVPTVPRAGGVILRGPRLCAYGGQPFPLDHQMVDADERRLHNESETLEIGFGRPSNITNGGCSAHSVGNSNVIFSTISPIRHRSVFPTSYIRQDAAIARFGADEGRPTSPN